jgi:hypothetical protein
VAEYLGEAPPKADERGFASAQSTAPSLRDGIKYCVVVFLIVRIGLSTISVLGAHLIAPLNTAMPPGETSFSPTGGWHNLWGATERSDAFWFERIARSGYKSADDSAAFFPLYPLAIRVVSWSLGGSTLAAALLVSNAAFLGALIVLYALTTLELSHAVARKTVMLIAIFPTAFFFLAPYSEGLFLLLSVSAFWFARRDRWWLAALTGALAALTRSVGVVLVPALAVEAFQQRREGRVLAPRLAAAFAVGIGPLLYFLWWKVRFNDPMAPFHAQADWQRVFAWPWMTLLRAIRLAWETVGSPAGGGGYWLTDLLLVSVVLLAIVAGAKTLRAPYLVYGVASVLIPLFYPYPGRPLLAAPRFVAELFPAFWVMAKAIQHRPGLEPIFISSFAALYCLFVVLFVNGHYIF